MSHNKVTFCVENAGNTCYIDSLLMGLFFEESVIERLLTSDIKDGPNSGTIMYLQEYIKLHFVDNVRNGLSVMTDVIMMLRELLIENGWKKDLPEEYFEQQDVNEFFTFLMDILNGPLLEIQRTTITELNSLDESAVETSDIEKIPFIPLSIPLTNIDTNINANIHIKDMFRLWMYENHSTVKRLIKYDNNVEEKDVLAMNTYNITNIPYFVAFGINRFRHDNITNLTIRDNTSIEIQQNIKLHDTNTSMLNQHSWRFHAVICHRGDSIKYGHYYTLLCKKVGMNNYKYYIFDDLKVPCLEEVNMSDPQITNQLKKEGVFIIYRYNA